MLWGNHNSASNILNFFNIHNYITVRWVKPLNLKRHLKAIFVFFAMSCATTIYTNLDTVMLGFMKADVDVGYYNAAVKVKVILFSTFCPALACSAGYAVTT